MRERLTESERPSGGAERRGPASSPLLSGELLQRGGEMLGGDGLGLGDRSGKERVVGEIVGLARQAAGGLEDRLDRGWLEERQLRARELEAMG